jgi:hypothetical protein
MSIDVNPVILREANNQWIQIPRSPIHESKNARAFKARASVLNWHESRGDSRIRRY